MPEQHCFQICRKSYCCLGRIKLCRDGTDQPYHSKPCHAGTHSKNIPTICPGNPHIYDLDHDQWDQQFKGSLQHLKEGCQYGFFFIIF